LVTRSSTSSTMPMPGPMSSTATSSPTTAGTPLMVTH
jgi:hypothetical protein